MAFTDQEKSDLRYYMDRTDSAYAGRCPYREQLEERFLLLSAEGEERVRAALLKLADLETKLCDMLECMNVQSVDGAVFRSPGLVVNTLRAEGRRISLAIARNLGISLYNTPFGPVRRGPTLRG